MMKSNVDTIYAKHVKDRRKKELKSVKRVDVLFYLKYFHQVANVQ
jgi:hypothetical protein